MDALLQHLRAWWGAEEMGEIPNHPDPAEPDDLGLPLSQDQIDFLKRLKKEIEERFNGPGTPGTPTAEYLEDFTITTGGPEEFDPPVGAESITLPDEYEGRRIRVLRNDRFWREWVRTTAGFDITGGYALEIDETLTIQNY